MGIYQKGGQWLFLDPVRDVPREEGGYVWGAPFLQSEDCSASVPSTF